MTIEENIRFEEARRERVAQLTTFLSERQSNLAFGLRITKTAAGRNRSPWCRSDKEMGYVKNPIKK